MSVAATNQILNKVTLVAVTRLVNLKTSADILLLADLLRPQA
jgi:hypothetical protein